MSIAGRALSVAIVVACYGSRISNHTSITSSTLGTFIASVWAPLVEVCLGAVVRGVPVFFSSSDGEQMPEVFVNVLGHLWGARTRYSATHSAVSNVPTFKLLALGSAWSVWASGSALSEKIGTFSFIVISNACSSRQHIIHISPSPPPPPPSLSLSPSLSF